MLATCEAPPTELKAIWSCSLREQCKKVRDAVGSGDANKAARFAFMLGMMKAEAVHGATLLKEQNRRHKQKAKRKATAEEKERLAWELFAEFPPADIKRLGKNQVYKQIGELMAARLSLPNRVPIETVRKCLSPRKSGKD